MRELDEIDRRFGLGAHPGTTGPREVRRTRHGVRTFWVALLTAALVSIVVAIHPGPTAARVRDVVGTGLAQVGLGGTVGDGSYAFISTQPGGSQPVGYDPCREISVEVNPEGAPSRWRTLVDDAMDHVAEASGLTFSYAGETSSRDFGMEQPSDATVLVLWATAQEFPALDGRVAGVGGSSAVQRGSGRVELVRGRIALDAEAFGSLDGGGLQLALDQAVVDHELGHVVGLDHVDDTRELMNAETGRQLEWGPGDREGLAILGDLPCG